jgi:hypothetical protein
MKSIRIVKISGKIKENLKYHSFADGTDDVKLVGETSGELF